MNNELIYTPIPKPDISDINAWLETSNKNFKKLLACDRKAKSMGSLVGRYFAIGHADGYAYYQVIKELKTRVHVQHIMGIGDDYADHYFGYGGSFPKNEVLRYVDRQGKMAELFG